MDNIFFNAHHSPMGAFSSFVLGFPGAKGGFCLESGKPADQSVFIGMESEDGKYYELLPFFSPSDDQSKRFFIEEGGTVEHKAPELRAYPKEAIQRRFEITTDTWKASELIFRIISPVLPIPNPNECDDEALKNALLPAIFVEITVDNTLGTRPRKAFFGFEGTDPYFMNIGMRSLSDATDGKIKGIGQGTCTSITTLDQRVKEALAFRIEDILLCNKNENLVFGLGGCGALLMEVESGKKETFKFAVCFFKNGIVTANLDAVYYYTKYFRNIEEVAFYALNNYDEFTKRYINAEQQFDQKNLSNEQQFMMAHAIRSYYGSTELLMIDRNPLWIVNEGEYRMMNTLDVGVDLLFFEIKMNPWVIRNKLDKFLERYSYIDEVRFFGEEELYPGGISFTHNMGVANVFSREHYSSYELHGLTGCYSYMTHEQLVNWLCSALTYIEQTGDEEWKMARINTLIACFESMLNRDHPDPGQRNGVMKLDSSRTMGGAEITTYDSLDASLGQARNNIYLAGKCWAVYVSLEKLFKYNGFTELAVQAGQQAEKCANTISVNMTEEGYIPAILEGDCKSKIIPAIEGLVYPYYTGCREALSENGKYGDYIKALKKHFANVLKPAVCLFEDGGWKLSSTSDNSWLSKIYLCQFVARQILDFKTDVKADKAHETWLTNTELSYWSWSDQIISGHIFGSKFYPRGVTSILWLEEK